MFTASGKAILYSYVIHHRKVPGFTPPYAIAVVELAEGPRMMTNIVDCPQTPEALHARHAAGRRVREAWTTRSRCRCSSPGEGIRRCAGKPSPSSAPPKPPKLGVIPDMSQIQLHADAALNAMADCGLKPKDIDGVATAVETPQQIAHYLGITPTWVDGTSVGGCSFMLHVRHAAAAIEAGLAKTILITHGESGKSARRPPAALGAARQPERPVRAALRPDGAAQPVPDPGAALHEDATASRMSRSPWSRVVQREWAAKNPRATFKDPITVDGRAELAHDRLSVPHPASAAW